MPADELRLTDLYVIPCVCGKTVKSATPSVICPHCSRLLEVDWQAEYKRPPAKERTIDV